jgi:mannose-6-phosphate isomerase-like protein (cupin superfamily)
MHILAWQEGQPAGFAAMEITVPRHFAGPLPHAHDEFDEAIYVLAGRLQVIGDDEAQEAVAGSMFVAARGYRHGFSNPYAEGALVLGIWAPAEPALAFHARDRRSPHSWRDTRPRPLARYLCQAR